MLASRRFSCIFVSTRQWCGPRRPAYVRCRTNGPLCAQAHGERAHGTVASPGDRNWHSGRANAPPPGAAGHVNHGLLWQAMSPSGGGVPVGALGDAIARDFGSFNQFKTRFHEAGAALRGSGWVWLARALKNGGRLEVVTTTAHDHPLM